MLVQLPLPKHINEYEVTSAVADEKDVDGFGAVNIGELAKKGGKPLFVPCTPKGVMALLKESGVDAAGKNAVVLGRSDIVGAPVSYLLRNADATVTVCHSKTADLKAVVQQGDILVAAIGKPGFVKGDWLKPGAVVIDVGTNPIPDDTKKSGQRLVGDVDYESAVEVGEPDYSSARRRGPDDSRDASVERSRCCGYFLQSPKVSPHHTSATQASAASAFRHCCLESTASQAHQQGRIRDRCCRPRA